MVVISSVMLWFSEPGWSLGVAIYGLLAYSQIIKDYEDG